MKKLWLFGALMDVDASFQSNMDAALLATFGQTVPFTFHRIGNTAIEIDASFGLKDWGRISPDTIPEPICFKILGDNPHYRMPNIAWRGYANINMDRDDFADLYRANTVYYGASRVKDISVTVNPQSVSIRVDWR